MVCIGIVRVDTARAKRGMNEIRNVDNVCHDTIDKRRIKQRDTSDLHRTRLPQPSKFRERGRHVRPVGRSAGGVRVAVEMPTRDTHRGYASQGAPHTRQ